MKCYLNTAARFVAIVFFLFVSKGYAQGTIGLDDYSKKILPPSPTAYSLGKYGLFKVSLNTGTNQVNVPLYQFKTSNLSIPISLDYSSNGLRVEDLPTWFGLSWNTTATGVIIRLIKDDPDKISNSIVSQASVYPQDIIHQISSIDDNLLFKNYLLMGVEPLSDTEPDQFSFNFLGKSGKFIITSQGEIITDKQSDLKIQMVNLNTLEDGFVCTDEKGIKYYFTTSETTTNKNNSVPNVTSVTGWFLTKIVHPLGDEVQYSYIRNITSKSFPGEDTYTTSSMIDGNIKDYMSFIKGLDGFRNGLNNTYSIDSWRLYSINSPNTGKVVFNSQNMITNEGDSLITNISIYNKENLLLEKADFSYLKTVNGRVLLQNINHLDPEKSYNFEYYFPEGLPDRYSNSVDLWGYYNGKVNSTKLPYNKDLPSFTGYADRTCSFGSAVMGMLKKVRFPTKGESEFLYESNDYSEELNTPVNEFFRLQQKSGLYEYGVTINSPIIVADQNQTLNFMSNIKVSEDYTGTDPDVINRVGAVIKLKNIATGAYIPVNDPNQLTSQVLYKGNSTVKFVIERGTQYQAEVELYASTRVDISLQYAKTTKVETINQVSGGLRIATIINNPITGLGDTTSYVYKKNGDNLSSGVAFNYYYSPLYSLTKYFFSLSPEPFRPITKYNELSLRSSIPNQLNYANGNSVCYRVVQEIGGSAKGGKIEHFYTVQKDNAASTILGEGASNSPLNYSNSGWKNCLEDSTIYYKKVGSIFTKVRQTRNNYYYDNLKSYYYDVYHVNKRFSTPCDGSTFIMDDVSQEGQHSCYLAAYYNPLGFTSSDVTKKYGYYYCSANHEHKWAEDIDHKRKCIAIGNNNSMDYFLSPAFGKTPGAPYFSRRLDNLDVTHYMFYSHRYWLSSTEETVYDGQLPVILTTNYYYDSPLHNQLTRVETVKSNGEKITEINLYPKDYAFGTTFIDNLVTNNIIEEPIETVSYLTNTNKILSATVKEYKATGNGLMDKVYRLESASPVNLANFKFSNAILGELPNNANVKTYVPSNLYAEQISFPQYDDKGNLMRIKRKDGISISYQWGYHQRYPIAECKNAENTEFYFNGFEDADLETVGVAHTGTRYHNGSYIVNWERPNGRIYEISYWYRNSGKWKYSGKQVYTTSSYSLTGGDAYDDITICPSDAQLTTYTYNPTVGITSSTDAKNSTTYYEYDSFQRLKNIKDQNGNIIKNNSYHYQL